jgi:hypothetical protein
VSKNYNHEIGYEALLKDFDRYKKRCPRGITLTKESNGIYLQFKIGDKPRSKYGCNCTFTLDGMISALSKAHKVADALKSFTSETEFWEWYDKEIKDIGKIENDVLTFREAIVVVEDDFWRRKDRRGNERVKGHPSHEKSWSRTYGEYYKYLPSDENLNLKGILKTIEKQKLNGKKWHQGQRMYSGAIKAYRKLAEMNKRKDIYEALGDTDYVQTEFTEKQEIDLESFIEWRDKTLGITEELPIRANLNTRKAWLWVFGMQIVYCLRMSEVFAIKNLDKPVYDPKTNKVIVHAYNDLKNNPFRLIYLGKETNLGTTIKTGSRLARPMIPPKYPNLYTDWDLQNPKLPSNKPKEDSKPETIASFIADTAGKKLRRWKAPFTQTHADRRLGNLLGMQAGISSEIRAKSMGHTLAVNDRHYSTGNIQTQIDVLTQSNKQAIDFTSGLIEAKRVIEKYPRSQVPIVELIAKIYQKSEVDIEALLS